MPRWMKVTGAILVLLVAVAGAGYYWYIADGAPPSGLAPYAFDLAEVRAKADELPGGKATEVHVETVARFDFPAVASVAGDGWNMVPMAAFSYQLVLPADDIVIDSAFNAAQGAGLNPRIDDDAYARMDTALDHATLIVVTHEHADHIGGIVAFSEPEMIRKGLRLNTEQYENVPRYGLAWPAGLSDYTPIDYQGMLAIAPGVVLIRAPGHTPGSQMVYVKCEDGRELLFIGDIGWTARNVETGRGRPRLLSQFMLNEDRDAVFAQLEMLKALHAAEPGLVIVPGHDLAAVESLVASGTLTAGFRL